MLELNPALHYAASVEGSELVLRATRPFEATLPVGAEALQARVVGGALRLRSPWPIDGVSGWRLTESGIASGIRVLLLDLGQGVDGATVSPTLRFFDPQVATLFSAVSRQWSVSGVGLAGAAPPPLSSSAPNTASSSAPTVSSAVVNSAPSVVGGLAAGPDSTFSASGSDPVPSLPSGPSIPAPTWNAPPEPVGFAAMPVTGGVPGTLVAGSLLTGRIAAYGGQTRVVFDLPPGTSYRVRSEPGGLELRFDRLKLDESALSWRSTELLGVERSQDGGTLVVRLRLSRASSDRGGWAAAALRRIDGQPGARLVVDLAPALARRAPVTPVLAPLPPGVTGRVVLDPGHGGKDPGAVGAVQEKQTTLDVALRVAALLRGVGIDPVLSRDSDRSLHPSKSSDLQMRAQLGSTADLFVSIHVNSMAPVSALRGYGVETWWNPNHAYSRDFASALQAHLVTETGAFSRGIHSNQSLAVLRGNASPAALVEIGFTSHPVDGQNLRSSAYLDRVALGIAEGIREALVLGLRR